MVELLERLDTIDGLRWIRLMYLFPDRHTLPILEAAAALRRVCPYVDLPFQHASPEVLRAMNRPGGAQEYLRMLENLRAFAPDVSVRSTFIVGFPGETPDHFDELLRFVEAAELDWVGAFRYSREEGSPAAARQGQVPARVRRSRYNRLMAVQQDISRRRLRRWRGRVLEVLVESTAGERGLGRTAGQAPEIDGGTKLDLSALPDTRPGDFVLAEVTGSGDYDLEARAVTRAYRPPRALSGLIRIEADPAGRSLPTLPLVRSGAPAASGSKAIRNHDG